MGRCFLLLGLMALTVVVLSQPRRRSADQPSLPEETPARPSGASQEFAHASVGHRPNLPLLRFPGPAYHMCLSVN